MVEGSGGSISARQRHSWWRRPPAWPDGRLLHPCEDPTTRVIGGAVVPLLAIWSWSAGRDGYLGVSVGERWWILAASLIAVSVVSVLVARRRIWHLAARSRLAAVQPQSTRQLLCVWRAPRWSDGRRVTVMDPAAMALMLTGTFAACGTMWLLSNAGVPNSDISGYPELLLLPLELTILAMAVRTQVVRAIVERWPDDYAHLGFIERRIAALAAIAKRANAQFASTP